MKHLCIVAVLALTSAGCTTRELSAERYDELSNKEYMQGSNLEALKHIEMAIEISPDDGKYWRRKGIIHREMGEKINELNAYEKAIELDGKDYVALFLYSRAMLENGDTDKALESINKAQAYYDGKNEYIYEGIVSIDNLLRKIK